MPSFKKTIFIIISRGLLVRNILRTTILSKLAADKNLQIVILIPEHQGVPAPSYLFSEFERDNVRIEIVPHKATSRLERLLNKWVVTKLTFSDSTVIYLKYHIKEERRVSQIGFWFYAMFYWPLSRLLFLKKFFRWLDLKFISRDNKYRRYFDRYRPDLVISTSIIANIDIDILKEAKRRGIKTVAMPRSWDNLDKFMFRVEPDILVVQNEQMKKEAIYFQGLKPWSIQVVGFPQFDMYTDSSLRWTKEEYCRHKGFDPKLPILFLGSEGLWSRGDERIFKDIVEARGRQIPDCNVLIRPHFSALDIGNYHEFFVGYKHVFIDDNFTKSDFWHDNWDPNWADMVDFTNSLYHSNIMITFASTLAIDFACFNKPVIAISYGIKMIGGQDKTHVMYESVHYKWVTETAAITLVSSQADLLTAINTHLKNPSYKQTERKLLAEKLAYRVDGQSAQRLFEVLRSLLYNEHKAKSI